MSTNKASELRHRLPFSHMFALLAFICLASLIWGCSDTTSVESEINDATESVSISNGNVAVISLPAVTSEAPRENISASGSTATSSPVSGLHSEEAAIMSKERMDRFKNNLACASPEANLGIMSLSDEKPLKWSHTDIIEGEIYFSVDRDLDSWSKATGAEFLSVHSANNLHSDYDYSWYGIESRYYFVELVDEYDNIVERISTRLTAKHHVDFAFLDGKIVPPDIYEFVAKAINPPKYKSIVLVEIDIDGNEREIARIAKSNNLPKASIIEPSANQIILDDTIEFIWTPSDLDQDYLTYKLWYSTDGGITYTRLFGEERIYTTLKSGIFTAIFEVNKFDIRNLIGSSTKLAVSVSDGGQSTFVESSAFCVPQINTYNKFLSTSGRPYLGLYYSDETVVLRVTDEWNPNRDLSSIDFEWHSSADGYLGTGNSLLLVLNSLSQGEHVISATGNMSSGEQILAKGYMNIA